MEFYNTHIFRVSTFFILYFLMLNQRTGVDAWSYNSSDTTMDWTAARNWCKIHFTDMVAIQNKGEIDHLNGMLPRVTGYYWIGIRKINNTWTWVGTNKTLTDEAANWAQGEPNNGRNNEDCVEIYIKRGKDEGMWNDESCQKKKTALCYTASCKKDSCRYGECVETINSHRCQCFEGFYGDTCQHVVKCEASEISKPEHGEVQCLHPNGDFSYKSECEYSCDEGYQLVGAKTRQCGVTTAWSNEPPTCELIRCSELNVTLHGAVKCSHPLGQFSYQSTCEFSCDEGFTLTGSSSNWLMCDTSGQWNDSQPTCEVVKCEASEISNPEHGKVQCLHPNGDFSYKSECEYSCDEGYQLVGAKTRQCDGTTAWSNEPPTCELIRCSELNVALHGAVQCSHPLEHFSYQSTCEFSCDEGFTLTGSGSNWLMCDTSGQWNDSQPTCEVVKCEASEISNPEHGEVQCLHPNGDFSYKSECEYSCDEGYQLVGAKTRQCGGTTAWSNKPPTCEPVRCPTLEDPVDGTLICTGDQFGSSCTFSCNAGFQLLGVSQLTCTKTAQWSQKTPSCKAIQCPVLQTPQDGDVSCTDQSLGMTCTFTCDDGFILKGASVTECTETGEWSADVPRCTAVTCPYIQEPINGFINCSSEEAVFSTFCFFSCLDGYQLHGHMMLKCGLNGNWTGEVPECQAHPVSISPSLGLAMGVGGTTAFSSLALALWILKRLRKLKAKKFDLSNSDIDVPPQVYKSSTDSLV